MRSDSLAADASSNGVGPATAGRRFGLRTLAMAVLAAALVWLILSRTLVAHLAEVAPEAALWLRPSDSRALINAAERRLRRELETAMTTPATAPDAVRAEPSADPSNRLAAFSARSRDSDARDEGHSGTHKDGATNDDDQTGQEPDAGAPAVPIWWLTGNIDPELRREIKTMAERALRSEPLNPRALRLLGQIAEMDGDRERAERLMSAAAALSLHESFAHYWLLQERLKQQDTQAALHHGDILLRTRPDLVRNIVPAMGRLAEDEVARPRLEALLAQNPPWRNAFFANLPGAITDARTPLLLLLSLRASPHPPTTAELRGYLNVLLRSKLYELAYYTWLQFLPADQLASTGLLFNASFEHPLSGLLFDWAITQGTGATIDIAPNPDLGGRPALYIEFGQGRVSFGRIEQTVLLAPGTYRFQVNYRGEVKGRRGLRWRVSCVGSRQVLGESPMILGSSPSWQPSVLTFTVPPTDCRAQTLHLILDARSASEQFVTGAIWFTDLEIRRE